jgi:aspartate aminotransferase
MSYMSPPLSNLVNSISGSTVVGMRRKADALEAQGMKIVDFGAGEPDFDAPPAVKEAGIKAIRDGHGHYVDPRGLLSLREAISQFEAEKHGVTVDPENIVVTPGSFGCLSLITRALFDPGDEVLIIEPCWGPYKNMVKLVGGIPVCVPMGTEQGRFYINSERIDAAVTKKTRAIIINTPWNPTGRVLLAEELVAIAEVAESHNLWIVADEVYSELVYGKAKHVSIASLGPDVAKRTVIATSLSKSFAMTGWRLGYCFAPPVLASTLALINHYTTRCATSIVQHAALAAFKDSASYVEDMRLEYARRRDAVVAGLNQIDGLECPTPEGTFYVFPQFPKSWGDSRGVATTLLEKSGIILSPGSAYGPASQYHLRLSFATSITVIEEGLLRLQKDLPDIGRAGGGD